MKANDKILKFSSTPNTEVWPSIASKQIFFSPLFDNLMYRKGTRKLFYTVLYKNTKTKPQNIGFWQNQKQLGSQVTQTSAAQDSVIQSLPAISTNVQKLFRQSFFLTPVSQKSSVAWSMTVCIPYKVFASLILKSKLKDKACEYSVFYKKNPAKHLVSLLLCSNMVHAVCTESEGLVKTSVLHLHWE